jgi:hypothetical protein
MAAQSSAMPPGVLVAAGSAQRAAQRGGEAGASDCLRPTYVVRREPESQIPVGRRSTFCNNIEHTARRSCRCPLANASECCSVRAMTLPPPEAFLQNVVAPSASSCAFGDAFAEWLKDAAVPPSWRGARVHSAPQAVPAPLPDESDSEEEEDDAVVVSKLTLEDCAVGDWVEARTWRARQLPGNEPAHACRALPPQVESGKRQKWFGQVVVIRPGSSQPLAVRWLGPSQPKAGLASPALQHTWTWRGGAHFIELAAVRQARCCLPCHFHTSSTARLWRCVAAACSERAMCDGG